MPGMCRTSAAGRGTTEHLCGLAGGISPIRESKVPTETDDEAVCGFLRMGCSGPGYTNFSHWKYSPAGRRHTGIVMGIYDRDWYKEEAKKRFQVSPSLKARRENKIRSAFEQYTNSVPQATGNRTGRNSLLTYALVWLGLGALCFSLFT